MGFGSSNMGYDNGTRITRRLKAEHPTYKGKLILADGHLIHQWKDWNFGLDTAREAEPAITQATAEQATKSASQQKSAPRPCARNARATLWYSGTDLYSYMTIIGRWVRPGALKVQTFRHPILLASSTEYSRTTNGQVGQMLYMVGGSARVLRVAFPDDIDRSMRVFERDFDERRETMNDGTKRAATRLGAATSAMRIADQALEARYYLGLAAVEPWIDAEFMRQRAELAHKVEHDEKMARVRREAREHLTGASLRAYIREAEKALRVGSGVSNPHGQIEPSMQMAMALD